MIDIEQINRERAALLIMHYQADVFSIIGSQQISPHLERTNKLLHAWRSTQRPVVFANFCLGPNYEHVNENNRLIAGVGQTGYFRDPTPVAGLHIEAGDRLYSCPRANVFFGTSLDTDLRTEGIDTLAMAGIASSGVLFSTVGWASDADYRIYLIRDCCFDPDSEAHDALFRTSFTTRAIIV
jgi:nicotinamidase-related amidase